MKMKKMKKTIVAASCAGLLGANMAFAAPPVLDSDVGAFAFQSDIENRYELTLLSEHEMQSTEGEFWPLILAGALLGGYTSGVGYLATADNPSWGEGLARTGLGALGGAAGGASGMGGILTTLAISGGGIWADSVW